MAMSLPANQELSQVLLPDDGNQLALQRSTAPLLHASRDYLDLLTRIPASEEPHTDAKVRYDGVLDLLLKQPPEMRQLILCWLDPIDLLNLRATSHTLHTLVHDSESAICVELSEQISKTYALNHLSISINDFSTYFLTSRWYRTIRDLSDIFATRICDRMSLRPGRTEKKTLSTVRSRTHSTLKWRLTRSFIILQYYLTFVFKTMIENEKHLSSLDDEDYIVLFNIFDLDQQHFLANSMAGLTESDFIDVTASWSIFRSVCKAKNVPLNLRTYAFCSVTIKQIFMYEGFAPFAKLLAKNTDSKAQQAILKQLDERQMRQSLMGDYALLESIQHLTICKEVLRMDFHYRRSSKAREAYINHQDIWDRSARALMMQKLGRFPKIMSASEWIGGLVSPVEKDSEVVIGSWNTA